MVVREQEPLRLPSRQSARVPGQPVLTTRGSPFMGLSLMDRNRFWMRSYRRLDLTRRSVGERLRSRPGLRLPEKTKRGDMGFLSDAVLSSISPCGRGHFYFGDLSDHEVKLLQSITQRQRQKFNRYGTVPEQVLLIAYENGMLPGNVSPKGGMKVKRLLTLLETGPYRDEGIKERALWFRDQIINEWKPMNRRRK